ncbi:MAG: hypothetical protein ACOYBY_15915 [Dermatophilaceae bacterium]
MTVTVTAVPGTSSTSVTPSVDVGPTPVTSTSGATLAPGHLSLSSFFNPSDKWKDDRYDVADRKQVEGIGSRIEAGCYDVEPAELELRLASSYKLLKYSVGQARDSQASDRLLSVRVVADNEQRDVRKTAFSKVQDFSLDVSNVGALKIQFYVERPTGQGCTSSSVKAVLFSAELQ